MNKTIRIVLAAVGIFFLAGASLFLIPKENKVRVLYATGTVDNKSAGNAYDSSAYDNFKQTLSANTETERNALPDLSARRLDAYDAIYLDPGLADSGLLKDSIPKLVEYVRQGGHLFLENGFASLFPEDFLGAQQVIDVPSAAANAMNFVYPEADEDIRGMQDVFRLYAGNFKTHAGMDTMPGFSWGQGIIPSSAQTLVALSTADGGLSGNAASGTNASDLALMTLNWYGKGSVVLGSTFLPNRYYITGFDLQSGMSSAQGFVDKEKAAQNNKSAKSGVAYFDKSELPLEPYFHFGFAAANSQLRDEFASYVSKVKYGYAVKKILGPNGRPAMAYQDHFEALPAFRDKEGIRWAELLKEYNQIPSYTLVRGSYDWGQWYEDIIVHLNTGTNEKPHYIGEYANSFYGSGVRLESGGTPLLQAKYPKYAQLADPIELPYRAYPALADWNGNGRRDLIAGSADGTLTAYANLGSTAGAYAAQPLPEGLKAPASFDAARKLTLEDGKPLAVKGYASPAAFDANGDGLPDLLIGSEDGSVTLALGRGSFRFAAPVPLTAGGKPLRVPSYAAPAAGDVDGDGIPDLVVGDAVGRVHFFRGLVGQPAAFAADRVLVQIRGKFAAPSLRDLNGDGRLDLAVGGSEGDVQVFLQQGGEWTRQEPIAGDTQNQMGNHALVGGHNSVPLWYDINGDGKDDLIVGQLEFGVPYAVDDPSFPYKKELQEFIQYTKDNHLNLYPHLFFHNYLSDAKEKQEIALHRKAFDALGILWKDTGTNQHTWRTNNTDRLQTLRNENEQDIWFNFGFKPSHIPSDPQWGSDYLWGRPFQLAVDGLKKPLLLGTPAMNYRPEGPGSTEDLYRSYIERDMPIEYFDHIEYHFSPTVETTPEDLASRKDKYADALRYIQYLDKVRTQEDYNFMTEPQMAQSFLTALNSKVRVTESWGMYFINRVKDKLGSGVHLKVTLHPVTSGVPEQAGDYRKTFSVAIEPGKRFSGYPLKSDADIFTTKNGVLYTTLQADTKVSVSWNPDPVHLIRANVPVNIQKGKGVWTIDLQAAGMQQVKFYSPVPLQISGTDLKLEEDPEAHTYTVTHYGDATTIRVVISPTD